MMANPLQRNTDLSLLHPAFRTHAQAVLAALNQAGFPFAIFEAFRFPERQADLYAQGRTRRGSIVTHAPPWRSYHQFGLGADFVLKINGNWTWDTSGNNAAAWQALKDIGAANGLASLDFERPHLQLAGTSSNALANGVYPTGGDESWAENLAAVIRAWRGDPPAPPAPATAERPPL